jgi:hypothetical protein
MDNIYTVPGRGRDFSLHEHIYTGSAARPVGSGARSLEIQRPECEANHANPSNSEVYNAWCFNSMPLYIFITWYFRHRIDLSLSARELLQTVVYFPRVVYLYDCKFHSVLKCSSETCHKCILSAFGKRKDNDK